ncbi:hypothetical protein HK101_003346 [Irineochytrium annulatum]|nr:hypothetical protein HK101_003346 [Irineochytrium annulatum]
MILGVQRPATLYAVQPPTILPRRPYSSPSTSAEDATILATTAKRLIEAGALADAIRASITIVDSRQDWPRLRAELDQLTSEMNGDDSSSLWSTDPERAIEHQRRHSRLDDLVRTSDALRARVDENLGLLDLAKDENDPALIEEVLGDLRELNEELAQYSLKMLMTGENDKCGCFVEFKAGAGGIEACDWAEMLVRMYQRWGMANHHQVTIVDEQKTEGYGYKSATLQISGEYAYGWLKHETGVHRMVRMAKFGESVFPLMDEGTTDARDIELATGDLHIEVMRAQGAGGQHVNKTESAVRITHIPTGIVAACQAGRSQHQNKLLAMAMIRSRIHQQQVMARAQARQSSFEELPDNNFGSQIRSYVLHPYKMVKDLRSGCETSDVNGVFDGSRLDEFLQANVLHFGKAEDA